MSPSPTASSATFACSPVFACACHISAYLPPESSSARCEPRSATRPFSRTAISSHRIAVDSRCAMRMVVRPFMSVFRVSIIPASVCVSSALVASSISTTPASFRNARANATRCFSPPLSLSPRSPTTVS